MSGLKSPPAYSKEPEQETQKGMQPPSAPAEEPEEPEEVTMVLLQHIHEELQQIRQLLKQNGYHSVSVQPLKDVLKWVTPHAVSLPTPRPAPHQPAARRVFFIITEKDMQAGNELNSEWLRSFMSKNGQLFTLTIEANTKGDLFYILKYIKQQKADGDKAEAERVLQQLMETFRDIAAGHNIWSAGVLLTAFWGVILAALSLK